MSFTTATAVEDSVLAAMKKAQDAVLDTARTLTERPEPIITNRLSEHPIGGSVPAPAEMATHAFDFIDRLKGNLRDFAGQLVAALAPSTADSRPTPAKAASKAHIHLSPEVAAIIALAMVTA